MELRTVAKCRAKPLDMRKARGACEQSRSRPVLAANKPVVGEGVGELLINNCIKCPNTTGTLPPKATGRRAPIATTYGDAIPNDIYPRSSSPPARGAIPDAAARREDAAHRKLVSGTLARGATLRST